MTTVILCALLAAVLYGVGAALEQHQAAGAPDSAAGRPRLLALLVRQPAWLLGMAAQVGGFAAHAAALRSGPLTIVQMLLAAELVVSVAIVRVRSGRPLPRKAWAAGAAVVGGIASFLVLTSAGAGVGPAAPSLGATGVGAAVAGVAAIAAAAVGLCLAGPRRALVLGVAAGLTDAFLAVSTTALCTTFSRGIAGVAGSWPVYAVTLGGLACVLLTQTAYQAGRPMITLPVVAAVTPVASVAIGVGFLGEGAQLGPARLAAAGIVAAATAAALVVLARCAPSGRTGPGGQTPPALPGVQGPAGEQVEGLAVGGSGLGGVEEEHLVGVSGHRERLVLQGQVADVAATTRSRTRLIAALDGADTGRLLPLEVQLGHEAGRSRPTSPPGANWRSAPTTAADREQFSAPGAGRAG